MVWVSFLLVLLVDSVLGTKHGIKPIEEYVQGLGYPIETHTITTADGYLLNFHRLPRARGEPAGSHGKPVLFVNGLYLSSASSLAKGNGLVYSLVDAGLDVWLANYRGNMYSRRHVTLNPDTDKQFWNYTLHELGSLDLPAGIDYILAETGYQRLFYIGFSMGTTMFWILGSTKPKYLDKIEVMVAIAPVARPSNCVLFQNWPRFQLLNGAALALWTMNFNEFLPYGETTSSILSNVCTKSSFGMACRRFIVLFNYLRNQGIEIDTTLKLIQYSPAGVSIKVALHYMQIAKAGRFQQYDYDKEGNQQLYNSDLPPIYNLKALTLPIYFVYSNMDEIATPQDIEWLANELPRRPVRILETINHFRHIDFNLNHNLKQLMSDPLTVFIKRLAEKTSYQQTVTASGTSSS